MGVMITVDEFIEAIKTQFDRHDLLEGANESAICFCPIAIKDSGRTIDLGVAGRIGANLGVLPAPMFDDFSILEAKQVEGDHRPREAAQAFVLRMKHDDVAIHERAIDRDVCRRGTGDLGRERLQAG